MKDKNEDEVKKLPLKVKKSPMIIFTEIRAKNEKRKLTIREIGMIVSAKRIYSS